MSASLFFRAQRIFLHNARGWFGDIPLEASGDFGIDPEEGEYHLMCQVYQCFCHHKHCYPSDEFPFETKCYHVHFLQCSLCASLLSHAVSLNF